MVALGALGITGGRAPAGPLNAQVGISDPCNHECVMCWDHPPDDRQDSDTAERFGLERPGVMSLDTFRSIVDELHRLGTRSVDLTGRGEPLLNRAFPDMIRYAKGRGFQVLVTTNASRLSEPLAREMVAVGVDRVSASVNAGTPETYPHIHVTETPQDYLRLKGNLKRLMRLRREADRAAPQLTLSFIIGSKNYFELERMVDVAIEIGADEARFVHTVVHERTVDLALDRTQLQALAASIPAARARATAGGVQTNLDAFAAEVPPYRLDETPDQSVVPCYVGWYFTVILGNGSVMPCCQCATPVGRVTADRTFGQLWASDEYSAFRTAARQLPAPSPQLRSCECNRCQLRPRNIAIHNLLHPVDRIPAGREVRKFGLIDFLHKMQGRRV
jgi:MoaA/NifB/PqqE/SkfB family radical SAM enzyme